MTNLVKEIYDFLLSIIDSLGLQDTQFNNFLTKNVFNESSLIGLNFTYYELFIYLGTLLITILGICLIVKLISKLIYMFKL